MAKKNKIKVHDLSRFLVYILGHNPHEFGLVPDIDGFISHKELLWALHEEAGWSYVRQSSINEVLLSDDRYLFESRDNLIRAVTRHWTLDTNKPADDIPALLYTGIRRSAHPAVLEKGLLPGGDKYHVLSPLREIAERIGSRRDRKPVILEIMSGRALEDGIVFYPFGDLYITREIPSRYIAGPPLPKDVLKAREERHVKKKETRTDFKTGTFILDMARDPDMARRKKGRKKKGWKEEEKIRRRRLKSG